METREIRDMTEQKKIPFDQEPIYRQKSRSEQRKVVASSSFALKLTVFLLSTLSIVFIVLFGVLFNRTKTYSKIVGNHATQYAEHSVVSNGGITDTAVNVALRSSVMVEAHDRESTSSHEYGAGAGVIVSDINDEVVICTNYHVCLDVTRKNKIADYIYVLLYDFVNVDNSTSFYESHRIRCSYVGGSYNEDVAVLKFARAGHAENLYAESGAMPVTIADSSKVTFGDNVIVIGNPSGKGTSVTVGAVSRPIAWTTVDVNSDSVYETIRCIQVDAAVNGGNSGGGLFDAGGNWIGLIESKLSSLENTNFALPSNQVYGVAWNIVQNDGRLKTVDLVSVETISRVTESDKGAITYVYDSVATENSNGIVAGDVFEELIYTNPEYGEITVGLHTPYALQENLLYLVAGDTITIKVKRNGEIIPIEITIATRNIVNFFLLNLK